MQEAVQQYIQRILGYLGNQDPLRVQAATVRKIERLVKGISAARLRKRPAPGKWSVAEILAHLADNTMVHSYRMRGILATPRMPITAYDQGQWAKAQNYGKRDPKLSLRLLAAIRESDLALLKSLRPEQWKLFGIHSERGQESIEKITRMMAGHDINHLRQIEAILAQKKRESGGRARVKSV